MFLVRITATLKPDKKWQFIASILKYHKLYQVSTLQTERLYLNQCSVKRRNDDGENAYERKKARQLVGFGETIRRSKF